MSNVLSKELAKFIFRNTTGTYEGQLTTLIEKMDRSKSN